MQLVSIIIPTYNRVSLLKAAVDSCIKQSHSEIEIIIIDDGSTDETESTVLQLLITKWLGQNIIYYKQNNSGASAARNKGLELSNGEFIQFLDSDDELFENKITLQVKAIIDNNADCCSCYGRMGENPIGNTSRIGESFSSKLDLMHKLCSGKVHVMSTPAVLWKKSVINSVHGWNSSIGLGDDLEFHVRTLLNVQKIEFINVDLFFVRVHYSNRLSDYKNNIKQIESSILTQQIITEKLKEAVLWDSVFQQGILKCSRTLYANYMSMASEEKLRLFENWLKSICLYPIRKHGILFLIFSRKLLGGKIILLCFKILKLIKH